jgi:outer membrane protein assembly factor BamA
MDSLVDFGRSYRLAYGELDVRWDTRRSGARELPSELFTRGTLLSLYGGPEKIEDGVSFWRYGIDVQQFFHLTKGPRALSLRFHGEAITAGRDEVSFIELPSLGGANFLRGYPTERFRDRVAAVATVEYQWDLSRHMYASTFLDVGRVFPSIEDVSLDDLRYSAGVALEGHSKNGLFMRVSLATAIGSEAGFFFNFYFSPVFEITPRTVRR